MKPNLLLSVLMVATLTVADISAIAVAATQPNSLLGSAAPLAAAADQQIVITDSTRFVNVTDGSTVRFVVGDRSFNWSFQAGTPHVAPFDLDTIAPAGLLTHSVKVYVAANPLYYGG
jgi:hypothetical protein